jgi:hypothetical protein
LLLFETSTGKVSSAEGESRGLFILSLCQPLKSLLFLLYTTDTLSSLLSLSFGSSLGVHLTSLDASFSRVELLILSSDFNGWQRLKMNKPLLSPSAEETLPVLVSNNNKNPYYD